MTLLWVRMEAFPSAPSGKGLWGPKDSQPAPKLGLGSTGSEEASKLPMFLWGCCLKLTIGRYPNVGGVFSGTRDRSGLHVIASAPYLLEASQELRVTLKVEHTGMIIP